MNKFIKLLVVALASLGCTTAVLASTSTNIMKIRNVAQAPLLPITVTYQTCYSKPASTDEKCLSG